MLSTSSGCNDHQATNFENDCVNVHTLWIGSELPWWVTECIASYLRTGHRVFWWVYREERQADFARPQISSLMDNQMLVVEEASSVLPYETAQSYYYHGMGGDGKYKGWEPFSDWFRYEILARYGGWWVDADSVSVRSLRELNVRDEFVICTERHRLDARTVGAVAIADPHTEVSEQASITKYLLPAHGKDVTSKPGPGVGDTQDQNGPSGQRPGKSLQAFHEWVKKEVTPAKLDVCLITNSHIHVPRPGTHVMLALASEMRSLLDRYASQVRDHGIMAVRTLNRGGRAKCSLPTGNIGMLIFQKAMREILRAGGAARTGTSDLRVLHWSICNPVDARDPDRMRRVLLGEEELRGRFVLSVHIFRQVRDKWKPQDVWEHTLKPRISDESPKPGKPTIVSLEVTGPTGPLWKRRVRGAAGPSMHGKFRRCGQESVGGPVETGVVCPPYQFRLQLHVFGPRRLPQDTLVGNRNWQPFGHTQCAGYYDVPRISGYGS